MFSLQCCPYSLVLKALHSTSCTSKNTKYELRGALADLWTGLYLCSTSLRTAQRYSVELRSLVGHYRASTEYMFYRLPLLFSVSGCCKRIVLAVWLRSVRGAEGPSGLLSGVWTHAVQVLQTSCKTGELCCTFHRFCSLYFSVWLFYLFSGLFRGSKWATSCSRSPPV